MRIHHQDLAADRLCIADCRWKLPPREPIPPIVITQSWPGFGVRSRPWWRQSAARGSLPQESARRGPGASILD
eukprot:1256956-Pyramimonas_sp.AAC.1